MSKVFTLVVLTLLLHSEILEICPNPYKNPKAEYVKIACGGNCTLSDGERSMSINSSGVFYVAKDRDEFFEEFGFYPDFKFVGKIALSNSADEIYLYENGKLVDSFKYGKKRFFTDKGLIYVKEHGGWVFRYEDWSDFGSVVDNVSGEIIVTPYDFHFEADEIVSYLFTTDDYVSGDFTLYLEAKPVGGIPISELDAIEGHKTFFLHSKSHRFHHWKFGLKDDRVVITTENWKWDKRGYIVTFKSSKVSEFLRKAIKHDLKYKTEMGNVGKFKRKTHTLVRGGDKCEFNGKVEVFLIPDRSIFPLLSSAEERLYVQVPYMDFEYLGKPVLLEILRNVSKRAEVKIILNDVDRNKETVRILKEMAKSENLNLDVKTMKNLHGKLVIVDDKALITSANFDEYGLMFNREICVVVYDKKAVDFLTESFKRDWRGDDYTYLMVAIFLLSASVVVTYHYLKRLRF
jgi:hypothetical protein